MEQELAKFIANIYKQRGTTTRYFKDLKTIKYMDISSTSGSSPTQSLSQKRNHAAIQEGKAKSAAAANDRGMKRARGSSESSGSTEEISKKERRSSKRVAEAVSSEAIPRAKKSPPTSGLSDEDSERRLRSSKRVAKTAPKEGEAASKKDVISDIITPDIILESKDLKHHHDLIIAFIRKIEKTLEKNV